MAFPALSEKLPKWHFLTPAWNFKIFWAMCLLLIYCESAIEWFFPKSVPSSVQVLFQVDKLDKLDYLKNPSLDLKNSFCFEFLWIPSNAGRQYLKVPFFLGFNLMKLQCGRGPVSFQFSSNDKTKTRNSTHHKWYTV